MKEYLNILKYILDNGEIQDNRTSDKTLSVFGGNFAYHFKGNEIPLLTTKKMNYESVLSELLWFLEGSTNERRLAEIRYGKNREELKDKRTIWTDNYEKQGKALGYTDGELGFIYGYQWRHWKSLKSEFFKGKSVAYSYGEYDQIENLIKEIKDNPTSRRLIVSAWNVADIPSMVLPPCHVLYQCKVHFKDDKPYSLSLQWYQRSVDAFLGLPYNIASYATLLRILCHKTNLKPNLLIGSFGDLHIYESHIDCVKEQLTREPLKLPNLEIINDGSTMKDFILTDYQFYEPIKTKMIV